MDELKREYKTYKSTHKRAYFMNSQGGQRLSMCIYVHMHSNQQLMSAIVCQTRLMVCVHSQDLQEVQSKCKYPYKTKKDIQNGIRAQAFTEGVRTVIHKTTAKTSLLPVHPPSPAAVSVRLVSQPSVNESDQQPDIPPIEEELFHPIADVEPPAINNDFLKQAAPVASLSPAPLTQQDGSPLRRSSRLRKMLLEANESLQTQDVVLSVEFYNDQMILEQNNTQAMEDPIAYAAKNDSDTIYFHQAMKELDREQFIKAVSTEINGHCERKHWELVPMTQ
eukprot:13087884-Ditylum_brightwellii.AAC.2